MQKLSNRIDAGGKVKEYSISYLILLLLASLFISLFCTVSSPLIIGYGGDSSIFMMMGRLFMEGKVPYVDFFDHKGPVIILIEWVGQLFAPYRSGLFILEVINLFLVLVVIDRIGRLVLDRKQIIVLVLLFLLFCSYTFDLGNHTEEYSLLPLFISLYISFRYYLFSQKLKPYEVFIIGFCFSFLFWMRVNNAGAICGMCIYFLADYLFKKDIKSIKTFFLYFIFAQLPLTILFVLYFGYYDAVYDLFYATFIFNFKYAQSVLLNGNTAISLIVFLIGVVGAVMEYKNQKRKEVFLFVLPILVCSMLVVNLGKVYSHYLVLIQPALILGLVFILRNMKRTMVNRALFFCSFFLFLGLMAAKSIRLVQRRSVAAAEVIAYRDLASRIIDDNVPAGERGAIYYYSVASKFYPIMEIAPNHKYFILQEWHGSHDAQIREEINQMMKDTPPLWILIEKSENALWEKREERSKEFRDIVNTSYELSDQNEMFILYRKK